MTLRQKTTNNLFVLLSTLLLFSCGSGTDNKVSENTFPVISPILMDTIYNSDYIADIHSLKNIEIRARVKGYLDNIYVDEGAHVKEGQLLFSISNQEYKEDLAKAQAMLKSAIADSKTAELELQNAKILVEKNIVAPTQLEIAKAKLEASVAKIDEMKAFESNARLRLAYTEIKAPFNGVIDRLPNKVGSLIDEGTLMTTLSDNTEIYAYFNVSEKEYLNYTLKEKLISGPQKVFLILADNTLLPDQGTIETIEGEFNQGTGNIAFRAKFPNPKNVLRHGSSGKVRIRKRIKNALIIPQKSTFEIQDKMYVFTLDKNNNAKMQPVTPGVRLPHLYIIASGLSTSDKIVYEGIQEIKEGFKVRPETVDLKKIISTLSKQ